MLRRTLELSRLMFDLAVKDDYQNMGALLLSYRRVRMHVWS